MIYCDECRYNLNCESEGQFNASLRSECFRDLYGNKVKPSLAELLNQPIAQEKPMEKIQMTEEQAICLYRMAGDGHVEFIKRLKQEGFIRKSAVEQAEESCENSIKYLKDQSRDSAIDRSINDIEKYIQELKSEIARLKK